MDIFMILSFAGGLALFLYGMKAMGNGLESISGDKLRPLLEKLCSNLPKSIIVGALVTAAVQSSSATTVMVVGFVNSGLLSLSNAVGVIMGANLGTTLTSWVLSLTGIGGDNLIVSILKPSSLAPILTLSGVIMSMMKKHYVISRTGTFLSGLGILFFGMELMSSSVRPLASVPQFTDMLMLFSNPLAGLAAGIVMTAVLQSSSASVGILQALSTSGSMPFSSAIPIVMGQNIGTCVTTLISSAGASKNAKRAAFIHLYFNLTGTLVLLTAFYSLNTVFDFVFYPMPATPFWIAVLHTSFNVLSTLILLPFSGFLLKLAELTVKDGGKAKKSAVRLEYSLLDERFLRIPHTALEISNSAYMRMNELVQENFRSAINQFENYDSIVSAKIAENEELIDSYQDSLGTYMIKLSAQKNLGAKDNAELTKLMYVISDTERIGDHAEALETAAKSLHESKNSLSEEAENEIKKLFGAVNEILAITVNSLGSGNKSQAIKAGPLADVIEGLCTEMREHHVERLKNNLCAPSSSPIFDGILIDCTRIAGHCSNIALSVIRNRDKSIAEHEYLRGLRVGGDAVFRNNYIFFKEKYSI